MDVERSAESDHEYDTNSGEWRQILTDAIKLAQLHPDQSEDIAIGTLLATYTDYFADKGYLWEMFEDACDLASYAAFVDVLAAEIAQLA